MDLLQFDVDCPGVMMVEAFQIDKSTWLHFWVELLLDIISIFGPIITDYCLQWRQLTQLVGLSITEQTSYERLGTALLVHGTVRFRFESFFRHVAASHAFRVSFPSLAALLIGLAYTWNTAEALSLTLCHPFHSRNKVWEKKNVALIIFRLKWRT